MAASASILGAFDGKPIELDCGERMACLGLWIGRKRGLNPAGVLEWWWWWRLRRWLSGFYRQCSGSVRKTAGSFRVDVLAGTRWRAAVIVIVRPSAPHGFPLSPHPRRPPPPTPHPLSRPFCAVPVNAMRAATHRFFSLCGSGGLAAG